jgi:hypothetical protein
LGLVVIVWLNAGSPEIDSPTATDGDFVGTALQTVAAVIEESLRRDLKLDVLDELWSTATLSEAKASELALEAQHATRPRRRGSGARRR